jgi:hypothetical protein
MVYEEIEIATSKHEITNLPPDINLGPWAITLYIPVLSTSILATCRLIHREAAPIMARKLEKMAKESPRISLDWAAGQTLFSELLRTTHLPSAASRLPDKFSKGLFSFPRNPHHRRTATFDCLNIEVTFISHDQQTYYNDEAMDAIYWGSIFAARNSSAVTVVYNGMLGTLSTEFIHGRLNGGYRAKTRVDLRGISVSAPALLDLDDVKWSEHLLELETL